MLGEAHAGLLHNNSLRLQQLITRAPIQTPYHIAHFNWTLGTYHNFPKNATRQSFKVVSAIQKEVIQRAKPTIFFLVSPTRCLNRKGFRENLYQIGNTPSVLRLDDTSHIKLKPLLSIFNPSQAIIFREVESERYALMSLSVMTPYYGIGYFCRVADQTKLAGECVKKAAWKAHRTLALIQ